MLVSYEIHILIFHLVLIISLKFNLLANSIKSDWRLATGCWQIVFQTKIPIQSQISTINFVQESDQYLKTSQLLVASRQNKILKPASCQQQIASRHFFQPAASCRNKILKPASRQLLVASSHSSQPPAASYSTILETTSAQTNTVTPITIVADE
jgi:hypothetical protein